MMIIERNGKEYLIDNGIESIYKKIKNGDTLHIDEITDAVSNINEYLELMYLSLRWRVDIKLNGVELDTTKSVGAIIRNMCDGLYEYGITAFHKYQGEPYEAKDESIIAEAMEKHPDRKCVGCGRDDDVVWLYIVPLNVGGDKVASNVIPLCNVHHFARIQYYGLVNNNGKCS